MYTSGVFQIIREKMKSTDRAVLLLLVTFLPLLIARFVWGFLPGYLVFLFVILFFVALLRPQAGVFALIVLTVLFERFFTLEPLQFGELIIKLYPLDTILLGVYSGLLAQMIYKKRRMVFDTTAFFLWIFFGLATVYFINSIVHSDIYDVSVALSTWKNYVFYGAIFFALPLVLEDTADIKHFIKYFLFAVFSGIIFIIIGVVRGEGLWTEFTPLSTEGIRLLAFPHAFFFSLATLGIVVSATFWEQYRYRIFLWGGLAFFAFGIVGSLMRHMWIGMFLALVFSYVFLFDTSLRIRTRRMFLIVAVFSGVLFSLAFFLTLTVPTSTIGHRAQSVVETISTRFVSIGSTTDTSISWRGSTWSSAFLALSRDLFLGTGFGVRIPVESGTYHEFVEIRNIHNSWLALLVQMGIGGSGVFLLFLFSLVFKVWRMVVSQNFFSALRMVLLVLFFYQSVVFLAQPYLETNITGIFFWLTLGLMQTILQRVKQDANTHL